MSEMVRPQKVLKFGGTSVGTVERIKTLPALIKKEAGNMPIIVVVSAFGGVTNQLTGICTSALTDFKSAKDSLDELRVKHQQFYSELTGHSNSDKVDELFDHIERLVEGISLLKEITKKSEDYILTSGELLSSFIISEYLNKEIPTQLFNSKEYLIISKNSKMNRVSLDQSAKRIKTIEKLEMVNVFPGFIASKENGITTSLGRGGSDYTASILANLFDIKELQIWTDVNGIMSADPRLVRQSKVLNHLSYEEALELSHFGAKVIYPPSIQPALTKGIPIRIKNTFDPEAEGTLVTKEWDENKSLIQGISSIKEVVLINMSGSGMVGIPSFSHRFFKALSDNHVNVIMITQASSEHSICVAIKEEDVGIALESLEEQFEFELEKNHIQSIEVERDLAIVAVVGSNMKNQVGVSGKMFHTLGKNGISVKAIAQGSSERNISAIIPKVDLKKALNTLHESFFLSELRRINLFIVGVGNVGQSFVNQVKNQEDFLLKEHNLKISICGVANSKKMVFDDGGFALESWKERLVDGETFDTHLFVSKMKSLNLRNSVFVDITASNDIASLYENILCCNVSVVTPNKIAATDSFDKYQNLLNVSLRNNVQFLFETNVAAGLPVISTLKDLIKSGDKIHKIEAVLSGTLNYLFNTYDGTAPFVEVIKDAKAKGLTEPDPRLDLFGEDVMRKILILARESGEIMEMEDVKFDSFIPQPCMKAKDLEDFYQSVEEHEEHFSKLQEEANRKEAKLRVVAEFENGEANVALKEVTKEHPFYHLDGKDNIVLFFTNRYSEQPLVIKGAGAGADVTASGIFADVLKTIMN